MIAVNVDYFGLHWRVTLIENKKLLTKHFIENKTLLKMKKGQKKAATAFYESQDSKETEVLRRQKSETWKLDFIKRSW